MHICIYKYKYQYIYIYIYTTCIVKHSQIIHEILLSPHFVKVLLSNKVLKNLLDIVLVITMINIFSNTIEIFLLEMQLWQEIIMNAVCFHKGCHLLDTFQGLTRLECHRVYFTRMSTKIPYKCWTSSLNNNLKNGLFWKMLDTMYLLW